MSEKELPYQDIAPVPEDETPQHDSDNELGSAALSQIGRSSAEVFPTVLQANGRGIADDLGSNGEPFVAEFPLAPTKKAPKIGGNPPAVTPSVLGNPDKY